MNLDLSWNHLDHLYKEDFKHLNNLTILNLSFNQIAYIQPGTWSFSKNLRRIFLNNNHLKYFEIFRPTLISLDLSNNPLECNCSLIPFIETVKSSDIHLSAKALCDSPPTLNGKDVRNISYNDMFTTQCQSIPENCDLESSHQTTLTCSGK